ncbi:hypothetical protein G9A89_011786 [Geosiphon pyriformis]|nr:hypothetical protein G9A89_011786 [Geosiphon pyriformis]
MAYALIAKLDKFNDKEDNAQNTTNAWYQSFAVKPQNFNGFKTEFLQEDTEAVTTYLGCFHRNLCQIQAIQANYFTVPQILNQFIRGLYMDFPTAVTYARDFEAAKLEANHTQALTNTRFINLLNGITIREMQIVSKISHVHCRYLISHGSQKCVSATTVVNKGTSKPTAILITIYDQKINIETQLPVPNFKSSPESRPIPTHLPAYNAPTNLSTTSLSNFNLSTAATSNLLGTATSNISTTATSNLSNTHHSNTTSKPSSNNIREPKIKDHPKLEISDGCTSTDSQLFLPTIRISSVEFRLQIEQQQQPPTNNIPPTTITENEFLDAIFPFELEEPLDTPLFSRAAFEEKLIMAIYTDTKIDGYFIKLILNSGLAGSIITRQFIDQLGCRVNHAASARIITTDGATKTPIGEIDDF